MFIIGVGTATPLQRYSQAECWKAAQRHPGFLRLAPRSQAIAKKVLLGANGIQTRHLAIDSIEEAFDVSPDVLHARFLRHAPRLACEAANRVLRSANIADASEIDGVIVSTCTGYLCPGLTSYIIEGLNLRGDVVALDLVGQGCAAALPNLQAGQALIAAGRCKKVLSICVEVCSAAFYLDDDPGVLISGCLFADAAGALVLSDAPLSGNRSVQWKLGSSATFPHLRDTLRFETKGGMLRNILTPEVPALAAESAQKVLNGALLQAGITQDQIAAWIWHAGGRDVLAALRERLQLPEEAFGLSAKTLAELGNVSSPFVIHVLERTLANGAPDGYWWMSSFGAGFSCHGALLEVRTAPTRSLDSEAP